MSLHKFQVTGRDRRVIGSALHASPVDAATWCRREAVSSREDGGQRRKPGEAGKPRRASPRDREAGNEERQGGGREADGRRGSREGSSSRDLVEEVEQADREEAGEGRHRWRPVTPGDTGSGAAGVRPRGGRPSVEALGMPPLQDQEEEMTLGPHHRHRPVLWMHNDQNF